MHTVYSIWPIGSTLSGATIPGQSGPGSNGNEGVLLINQIFNVTASPSDGFLSPRHSKGLVITSELIKLLLVKYKNLRH